MHFPMSLRWSSYVVPKGGSKTQNDRFSCIIALHLKKVCYRVSLCKNCQQHSCKAFVGLTIRAKMIGGGYPFYLKFFWYKLIVLEQNRRFSVYFRWYGSASAVTSGKISSVNTIAKVRFTNVLNNNNNNNN